MSISDPTPQNLVDAAEVYETIYNNSPFPHHIPVLLLAAAKRIAALEQIGINQSRHIAQQDDRIVALDEASRLDACTIDHYRQEIADYKAQRKTLCIKCKSMIGIGENGLNNAIQFPVGEKEVFIF